MATTVVPTAVSEAPAGAAPAAPEGGTATETAQDRRERALALAAERNIPGAPGVDPLPQNAVDAALEARNRAAQNPNPLAGTAEAGTEGEEVAEGDPVTGDVPAEGEVAADPSAEVAEEIPAEEAISIAIPVQGSEDPFVLEVSDPETAEHINGLIRRAERGERAQAIRQEAQQMREEVEEFHYAVEMDPTGVLDRILLDPPTDRQETHQERQSREHDTDHLFLKLLTKPGVLERHLEVVGKMMDNPETIDAYAEKVELERLRRQKVVEERVNERRVLNQRARQLETTIHKTIASLAPDTFTDEGRIALFRDIMRDAKDYERANNLAAIGLHRIPGLIQQRFKYLGIAPKSENQNGNTNTAPRNTPGSNVTGVRKPPVPKPADAPRPTEGVAPSPKTAAELKAAAERRQGAASAAPGAGAAANAMPARPAYDPSQPGTAVQQSTAWARKNLLPWLKARPQ